MLWHGMKISGVFRLLRKWPELHWTKAHRVASLFFTGTLNSLLGTCESAIYGSRVRKTTVDPEPIFILGYWRSGTTLLHNLLSSDPNYQHLTTYRALFPWHFLLTEKLVTKIPMLFNNRPMDNMKVTWDSPQEDDMASCIMSQVSAMMLLSHPHDFRQFWASLDLGSLPESEFRRWRDDFELLLKKMTFRDPRPVILKSPYHTCHIPQLLELFPKARFVYIHRHPYHVFRSTLHLRRRGIEENSFGRDNFDKQKHQHDIIESYRFSFQKYETDRKLIPEHQLIQVAFGDLEQAPVEQLQAIYEQLKLPGFEVVRDAVEEQLTQLKAYKKNQFDPDPDWERKVFEELQPVYERFGYQQQSQSGMSLSPKMINNADSIRQTV